MMRSTRRSESGQLLPDHEYTSWCGVIGCSPIPDPQELKKIEVKMGEQYFKMLEETAKRVDTRPEWKKG